MAAIVLLFDAIVRGLVAIWRYGVPLLLIATASFVICDQTAACSDWLCTKADIC